MNREERLAVKAAIGILQGVVKSLLKVIKILKRYSQ